MSALGCMSCGSCISSWLGTLRQLSLPMHDVSVPLKASLLGWPSGNLLAFSAALTIKLMCRCFHFSSHFWCSCSLLLCGHILYYQILEVQLQSFRESLPYFSIFMEEILWQSIILHFSGVPKPLVSCLRGVNMDSILASLRIFLFASNILHYHYHIIHFTLEFPTISYSYCKNCGLLYQP